MTKSHKRRLAKQQRGRPGGWLMRECEVLSSIPWTYRRRGVGLTRVTPVLEKQSRGLLQPWDGWPCLLGMHEVSEILW